MLAVSDDAEHRTSSVIFSTDWYLDFTTGNVENAPLHEYIGSVAEVYLGSFQTFVESSLSHKSKFTYQFSASKCSVLSIWCMYTSVGMHAHTHSPEARWGHQGPHSITSVVEPGAKLAGQQTTMLLTVLYVPKYVWPWTPFYVDGFRQVLMLAQDVLLITEPSSHTPI